MIRRALLFVIIGLFCTQRVSAQQDTLRKVNFLPQWSVQSQFAGYYIAKEKGIYEKYRLDVNIIDGGYGKDVIRYLKEGKADFGTMYLTTGIKAHADGLKLVNIAQIIQESGIMFVTKKASGINNLYDFNGKKIAVWRTILQTETMGFLKHHSIDADILGVSEGVNLFLKDGVDICSVMYYNEYNDLYNYGINRDELNTFYFKDYNFNFPEDGIYCLEKTLLTDSALCKDFKDATLEGWEYVFANPGESLELIRKKQKELGIMANQANSRWMLNCMEDIIKPKTKDVKIGQLLESDFNYIIDFLLKEEIIDNKIDFYTFYRNLN